MIFEISHLLLILFLGQKVKRLDVRQQSPNPMGFGQPARAQFKYQQPQRQPVGFIQTDHLPKATPPAPATPKPTTTEVSNPKLGTAETQLEMSALTTPETSTYNRELAGHGIHSPADKALNKTDIQRIIDKGLSAGKSVDVHSVPKPVHSQPDNVRVHKAANVRVHSEDTPKPTQPDHVRAHIGSTSKAGNVQGNEEAALLAALKDAQGKIDTDTLRDAFGLYQQWADAVKDKQAVLSARGGRKFINLYLCQARKKTITPGGMDALLTVWRKRAHREGLLKPNPKYTGKPPHPEYLLI